MGTNPSESSSLIDKSDEEILRDCERQKQTFLSGWNNLECSTEQQSSEKMSEKRPREKGSEGSSEEGFTTIIKRKPKRLIRSESIGENINTIHTTPPGTNRTRASRPPRPPTPMPADNETAANDFEVCLMSTQNMLPKQMALAKLLKSGNIQNVLRIKYKSPYKVFVLFDDKLQAEKLLSYQVILDLGVRAQFTDQANLAYGMIKGVDLEMNEQEVVDSLNSSEPILAAKRLKRMNDNGEWIDSETMRICFKSTVCPTYVYAFGCRFKVERYIFPVTQCAGCWKFGHIKRYCPLNKTLCPKCGKEHNNCEIETFKCLNCKGPHMALDKKCSFFIKEKAIRVIMSEENLTYKKALELYLNKNKQEVDLDDGSYVELPKLPIAETSSEIVDVMDMTQIPMSTSENNENRELNSSQIKTQSINQKTQKKKKNKNTKVDEQQSVVRECEFNETSTVEELVHADSNAREETETTEDKKKEHKFEWRKIFQKIRDAVFTEGLLEDKITAVLKIVCAEIKSLVLNIIRKGDLLKGLLTLFDG